jgi:hypothetical protein
VLAAVRGSPAEPLRVAWRPAGRAVSRAPIDD